MSTDPQHYYSKQPEPIQSCLLALKTLIMASNRELTHERRYQIPFFCFRGKKVCFLWVTRKKVMVGFVEDSSLQPKVPGIKRKDRFETLLLDAGEDIPVELILERLTEKITLAEAMGN